MSMATLTILDGTEKGRVVSLRSTAWCWVVKDCDITSIKPAFPGIMLY